MTFASGEEAMPEEEAAPVHGKAERRSLFQSQLRAQGARSDGACA
jgi:hypothetical protein